jgi:predicted KAP-like P-loop ATPase
MGGLVLIKKLNIGKEDLESIKKLKESYKLVVKTKEYYSKLWEEEEDQLKKHKYLEIFRDYKRVAEQNKEELIELLDEYELTFEELEY